MLKIPSEIRDQMIQHANDGLPNEACGLFVGERLTGKNLASEAEHKNNEGDDGEEVAAKNETEGEATIISQISQTSQATQVTQFFPMENAAQSVELYTFDPAEHMKVEKLADESGVSIVGVMHSHTYTAAYPSPTDVEDATNFDPFGGWHYIIVSLQHETPELRSFRIIDSVITEEAVQFV